MLTITSCSKDVNRGKFIFYSNNNKFIVENYEIYEDKLGGLSLVIKEKIRRNYIVNLKIDSLHYELGKDIYKAKICKINEYYPNSFILLTLSNKNDGLDIKGFDEFNREKLYIGNKKYLQFIVDNNFIERK